MNPTDPDGGDNHAAAESRQAPDGRAGDSVAAGADDLARENAYLREALARYREVAESQASLLARIATLEAELKAAHAGHAGQLQMAWDDDDLLLKEDEIVEDAIIGDDLFDEESPEPVAEIDTRDPLEVFTEGMEPAAGSPRMLIVAAALIDPIQWDLFGRQQLNDVIFGLPDNCGIDVLAGPMPDVAIREFGGVARKYSARIHTAPEALVASPETWAGALAVVVEKLQAEVVIFLDPSSFQTAAMERMNDMAARKVGVFSGGELRDILAPAGTDQAARMTGALAGFDMLLTTSSFEAERFRTAVPRAVETDVYLRGVDVTQVLPRAREASDARVVGIGADRLGPAGLRDIIGAASAMAHVEGVEFRIYSASALPGGANLTSRKVSRRSEYAEIYRDSDFLIVPPDCTGFSQTLMEAMASGCVCLVPERAFAEYMDEDLVPFECYSAKAGGLVDSLRFLVENREHAARIARDAPLFARRYLRRSFWREKLRNLLAQVEP